MISVSVENRSTINPNETLSKNCIEHFITLLNIRLWNDFRETEPAYWPAAVEHKDKKREITDNDTYQYEYQLISYKNEVGK